MAGIANTAEEHILVVQASVERKIDAIGPGRGGGRAIAAVANRPSGGAGLPRKGGGRRGHRDNCQVGKGLERGRDGGGGGEGGVVHAHEQIGTAGEAVRNGDDLRARHTFAGVKPRIIDEAADHLGIGAGRVVGNQNIVGPARIGAGVAAIAGGPGEREPLAGDGLARRDDVADGQIRDIIIDDDAAPTRLGPIFGAESRPFGGGRKRDGVGLVPLDHLVAAHPHGKRLTIFAGGEADGARGENIP